MVASGDSDDGLNEARKGYNDGDFEIVFEWATKNWKDVGERHKVFELEEVGRDFKQRCRVKGQELKN